MCAISWIDIIFEKLNTKNLNMMIIDCQVACKLVAQTMSRKYGPSWNCAIGTSFACEVVFQKHTTLLLYYGGQFAIMLGKNTWNLPIMFRPAVQCNFSCTSLCPPPSRILRHFKSWSSMSESLTTALQCAAALNKAFECTTAHEAKSRPWKVGRTFINIWNTTLKKTHS
jgi:hypothetical protein